MTMSENARQAVFGVAALLILGGAVALYIIRSYGGHGPPTEFNFHGVCLACQEEVDAHATLRNPPPLVCPHCGEVAVYRLLYCTHCRHLFAMPIIRRDGEGRPRPAMTPSCSGCGSADVRGYPAGDPNGYEIEGRVPLPPWPPDLPE